MLALSRAQEDSEKAKKYIGTGGSPFWGSLLASHRLKMESKDDITDMVAIGKGAFGKARPCCDFPGY